MSAQRVHYKRIEGVLHHHRKDKKQKKSQQQLSHSPQRYNFADVDFQEKTEDSMCSDFYKIYTLWEYPHKSLAEDLANRKIYKTHFS